MRRTQFAWKQILIYGDGLANIFHGVYTEYGKQKRPRGISLSPCYFWSRLPDLNWRPHPYHGCALPAELSRLNYKYRLKRFPLTAIILYVYNCVCQLSIQP